MRLVLPVNLKQVLPGWTLLSQLVHAVKSLESPQNPDSVWMV